MVGRRVHVPTRGSVNGFICVMRVRETDTGWFIDVFSLSRLLSSRLVTIYFCN